MNDVHTCKYCGYSIVNDEEFYVCPCCDKESCTSCAGRCGCEVKEDIVEDEAACQKQSAQSIREELNLIYNLKILRIKNK